MFLSYYGLRAQPFGVTPDARFLFLSASHREALASLCYGIRSGRGFLGLIAQPGMGKTTILAHLLESLRESARTAFLFQSQCDSREFLRFLLADLGVSSGDSDLVGMQHKLNEVLIQELNVGRRVVIVIDEAQGYDNQVLETIRMLSNFETPRAKLMQIVLAGQPQLADRLASEDLVQLRQRISILCRLTPLTASETAQYISHRVRVAGYTGSALFTPEALAIISSESGGIPRNINNLCFQALTLGFAKSQKIIDGTILEEVLADLDLDSVGTEAAAKKISSSDSMPLPAVISSRLKEQLGKPIQSPSAASEGANLSNPVVPKLDEFFPSEFATPAKLSAKDRDSRQPVANAGTEQNDCNSGRRTRPVPRWIPTGLSAGLSKFGRAAGSIRIPQFDRRLMLVPAAAVLSLVAGVAGSRLFSVHARSVQANPSAVLPVVEVPPEPPQSLSLDSAAAVPPSDLASETSEPHARPVEGASKPRLEAVARSSARKSTAGGRNGPMNFAESVPAPLVKPNQILPETLPLSKRSGITEINTLAPARAKTEASAPTPTDPMLKDPPKRIGGEFVPPKLLSSPPPSYPALAKRAQVNGDVTIRAEIGLSGRVDKMTVMPGSPMLLRDAALQALQGWKYEPAKLDGHPIPASVIVTIRFREQAEAPQSEQTVRNSKNSRPLSTSLESFACRLRRYSPLSDCSSPPQGSEKAPSQNGNAKP